MFFHISSTFDMLDMPNFYMFIDAIDAEIYEKMFFHIFNDLSCVTSMKKTQIKGLKDQTKNHCDAIFIIQFIQLNKR